MKKIYTLLLFTLLNSVSFAQDTLFTTSGKTINAKVIEVGKNEVKYRTHNDSEKQYSVISLSEIIKIHYENGTSDVFIAQNNNTLNEPSVANNTAEEEYAKRQRRADAITDGVIIGFRVVGFILRVALEIAMAGSCNSSHDYHSGSGNYGTNRPRGH